MNMFIMFLVYIVTSTTTIADNAGIGRGKNNIDNGGINEQSHFVLPAFNGAAVFVDSSGNAYTAWGQAHECLAYNPTIGGLQFVCRGYSPTGILNVHQTDSIFSFWVDDAGFYNQEYGPARYPHSIAGNDPYICFPYLFNGSWGGAIILWEVGGWFSSIWALPDDLILNHIVRVIGHQYSFGNITLIMITDNGETIWFTMTADLTPIANGSFGYDYLWGYDINADTGYVFLCNDSLGLHFYRSSNGVIWTGPHPYNLVLPNPYANNLLFNAQLAVTDAGNPILVFDNLDNDDYSTGTYPYLSKVYISTASGQPCIEASTGFDRSWYPTVAANGNDVVVLFHSARQNFGIDSLAFQDLIAAISTDNGATFSHHHNLTADLTNRPGLAQLSKRFAANLGRFYYFYGVNMINNHDPIWHLMRDPEGLDPHAWYVGWHETETGISEDQKQNIDAQNTVLSAYPNPYCEKTDIRYSILDPRPKNTTLKIFNAAGRLVNSLNLASSIQDQGSVVSWLGDDDHGLALPPGVYFVDLRDNSIHNCIKVIKSK